MSGPSANKWWRPTASFSSIARSTKNTSRSSTRSFSPSFAPASLREYVLEADNVADNRFDKICRTIGECRYGVHDISWTEVDGEPPLPRFNMPLELGLFLGARKYGGRNHGSQSCIIFDRELHRFQRYISDIAGQDIHAHLGDRGTLIVELATWLRAQSRDPNVPDGAAITGEFEVFSAALPEILEARRLAPAEVTFVDYSEIVVQYLTSR